MRKRHPEQETLFPHLDYRLMQERQNGLNQSADSFTARVSRAYEQFDRNQDMALFNQRMHQFNQEASLTSAEIAAK
jgi:hypothetical protein